MARYTRAKRRKAVRSFVHTRDIEGLLAWARKEPDTALMVVGLAFDPDETLCWQAIDALGHVAAQLAQQGKLEKVRGLIRRLLWLMNDESGGIAWHGPEAIAEILAQVPPLLDEYGRIVASYIDQPPFGPGVHHAVAKLAANAPEQFEHVRKYLEDTVVSGNPAERGYGVIALAALAPKTARIAAKRLLEDTAEIREYDPEHGSFRTLVVGDLARRVIQPPARAA